MRKNLVLTIFAGCCVLSACGKNGSSLPAPIPPPVNLAPVANAAISETQTPEETSLTLSAAGSSDPEGAALVYSWTQTAGTPAQIADANAVQTSVTFPDVPEDETMTFNVSVSDGTNSAAANVSVTVTNVRDVPNMAGMLEIRTSGNPVSVSHDLSFTADAEFLVVEDDGNNATDTNFYQVNFDANGNIVDGAFNMADPGYNQYTPQVRFERGPESSLIAFEPDAALVLGRTPKNDPSGPYTALATLTGSGSCVTQNWGYSISTFNSNREGQTLIGRRNGGAARYDWDGINDALSHSSNVESLTQIRSYCGYAEGPPSLTTGRFRTFSVAMLDVDTQTLGIYSLTTRNSAVGSVRGTRLTFVRDIDVSGIGLDPTVTFQTAQSNSALSVMAFSDGMASGKQQLLFMSITQGTPAVAGDFDIGGGEMAQLRVVDYAQGVPSDIDTAFIPSAPASGDPGVYRVMVTRPTEDSVLQIPVTLRPLTIGTSTERSVGLGATTLSSSSGVIALTYPDEKRVRVFPVP